MNEIQITAYFDIHDGHLDQFKSLARDCMESVREKDTGTLQYDWFFNDDHTECVVRERYVDSDAVLEHVGNLGDTFGALLGVSDFSAEVCGSPSEALLKATKGLDLTTYRQFQGM